MPQPVIEAALDEWALALRGYTGEQVIDALRRVRESGMQFAPDLPAFIGFCKQTKPAHPSHVERYPAIPSGTGVAGYVTHVLAKGAATPKAQAEMEKIRGILRKR
jgi:hypothetical protein